MKLRCQICDKLFNSEDYFLPEGDAPLICTECAHESDAFFVYDDLDDAMSYELLDRLLKAAGKEYKD